MKKFIYFAGQYLNVDFISKIAPCYQSTHGHNAIYIGIAGKNEVNKGYETEEATRTAMNELLGCVND